MIIQWYPGHMTKAIRMMEENVRLVDAVIYVLDARAFRACINPSFEKLAPLKPRIYVLNKADTVEKSDLNRIIAELSQSGYPVVATDSVSGNGKAVISELLSELKEKREHFLSRGINKTMRAMVIGVPNCGKSTFVNSVCGNKRAITGNKPGVTRGKQWVAVTEGLDLLDTPGTLWPSFEDQELARHLAYIGCIKDDILNVEDLCLELIKEFSVRFPQSLESRYGVKAEGTPLEIYEAIAAKRGFLLKGKETDYERTAKAVLDDFRKQRLGKIALE